MICRLCPRKCGAKRTETNGGGFCGLGALPKAARIALHPWEEPCISGSKGTGAVFFSGCTMRCVYCQNYEISASSLGLTLTASKLSEEFRRLEDMGAQTVSLISPTPYVPEIIKALDLYKPSVPAVYNCGGYERVSVIRALEGYIDVYLPDFKYSSDRLAEEYSSAADYVQTAEAAISEMLRQTGSPVYNEDGIMLGGTIIRHLVLPNHTKNSIGVLDIIKEKLPKALVSLMGQYVPLGRAGEFEKLNRRLTKREYTKVRDHLFELGLDGFVQELSSADTKYVPEWDLV